MRTYSQSAPPPRSNERPVSNGPLVVLHAGGPTPIHLLCDWSRSHAAASEGSNAGPRKNLRLFCGGLRRGFSLPDPDRLDAVLTHGFHPDRVAVGAHGVAAFRQPAELCEDEAADRVVGVGVDRQV